MKKNKQLFCKLMAGGIYTAGRAVELVWGDVYDDANKQGEFLLTNKKIKNRIKDEVAGNVKMSDVSRTWIKNKLVDLVERSSSDPEFIDPNVVRYSLDMINKMDGNYSDDNSDGVPVVLKMSF